MKLCVPREDAIDAAPSNGGNRIDYVGSDSLEGQATGLLDVPGLPVNHNQQERRR